MLPHSNLAVKNNMISKNTKIDRRTVTDERNFYFVEFNFEFEVLALLRMPDDDEAWIDCSMNGTDFKFSTYVADGKVDEKNLKVHLDPA